MFYYSQRTNQLANVVTPEIQRRFQEECAWERMKPCLISIYTNTYTADELRVYVEFYSSPAGRSRRERSRKTSKEIGEFLDKKAIELGAPRF